MGSRMQGYKERALEELTTVEGLIKEISRGIYQQPELGNQEFKAVQLLVTGLEQHGFNITRELAGLPTAFKAEYPGKPGGPRIAFLAEYDALPELGHACGHNLIGAASFGAGLVVSRFLKEIPGSILVIGTPAEETNGAKVALIEAGVFEDIDITLMFHPGNCNAVEINSLAMEALEFVFQGQAAHAVACPQKEINALEALVLFFVGINALRRQLGTEAYIHGIISDGGITPNIIPERAAARFYIRARQQVQLEHIVAKVQACAQGVASLTGATVKWFNYEASYKEMVPNPTLATLFRDNLIALGVPNLTGLRGTQGSLDMGNVSQLVPSLHPYLMLRPGLVPHSREFTEAAGGTAGEKVLLLAVKALAWTALDLLFDPALVAKAWKELRRKLNIEEKFIYRGRTAQSCLK